MYLLIDTTEHNKARLKLLQGGKISSLKKPLNRNLSEKLLFIVESFIKSKKSKFTDISGIAVTVGEGSFTGIRTGIATANSLGYALKIPVISVKLGTDIRKLKFPKKWSLRAQAAPVYAKPPNITKAKKSLV